MSVSFCLGWLVAAEARHAALTMPCHGEPLCLPQCCRGRRGDHSSTCEDLTITEASRLYHAAILAEIDGWQHLVVHAEDLGRIKHGQTLCAFGQLCPKGNLQEAWGLSFAFGLPNA